MVGQQNADIADTLQLRDVAMANIFWLSIYGVHICATWRIRLNRLHVAEITLTTCLTVLLMRNHQDSVDSI